MPSSTSGIPHQTTAAMKANENTSANSFTISAAARQRRRHVEQLRDQRDGEVCLTPLRDAEVEEHPAEDEEGDRVLLPLERQSQDVAPPDLEQREQRRADEQNRRGGREDAVLERPPGGVGRFHRLADHDLGGVLRAIDLLDPRRARRVLRRELLPSSLSSTHLAASGGSCS